MIMYSRQLTDPELNPEQLASDAKDNFSFPRQLPFDWWRREFTNTVDLETSKALYATLVPQGGQAHSETQDLKKYFELRIPTTYLYLTDDLIGGSPHSETSWHPVFSRRVGPDCKLVKMPGDHEALLNNPVQLAEKLTEASVPS